MVLGSFLCVSWDKFTDICLVVYLLELKKFCWVVATALVMFQNVAIQGLIGFVLEALLKSVS